MRTILVWQDKGDVSSGSSGRVGNALFGALSGLFSAPLYTFIPQCSAANVVLVGEELRDWRLPFFESCASSWAIAPDYPLDAVDLVESLGAVHAESGILTSLAALLETSAATVLLRHQLGPGEGDALRQQPNGAEPVGVVLSGNPCKPFLR
jgi:hypothetical protein